MPQRICEVQTPLSPGAAMSLVSDFSPLDEANLKALVESAKAVQQKRSGDHVDLCAIVNAKSGLCEQDCAFCAQSSKAKTEIDIHGMKNALKILEHAKRAEEAGAHRFCIVTSGGALSESDFEIALTAVTIIRQQTGLMRCASLGSLSRERVEALVDAGLSRYHHNLETARSYYPSICSTQPYERRVETIRYLKEAGVETCVGGILGLGETPEQRIEFASELQALTPDSVPINFLSPRPGTGLEHLSTMPAKEAIFYLAIFRLMLPGSIIRLAGGRTEVLGDLQEMGIKAGIDGLLIGDYLTTFGPQVEQDLAMFEKMGFNVGAPAC